MLSPSLSSASESALLASGLASSRIAEASEESQKGSSTNCKLDESVLSILDGKYFRPISQSDLSTTYDHIVATCVLCEPKSVAIKGYRTSSTNFVSHLKRRHGDESVMEYKKYAQEKKLQTRAENANTPTKTWAVLTPEEGSELLVKFIINAMIPLRTVEDPYFRKLIRPHTIISRRTLSRRIKDWYTKSEGSIIEMCRTPQYICTTCDIWSGKKRSFFGVTAHWITENFERKSAALACRRFNNKHTGERIASLLTAVHVAYEIENKVVATVTDNASNFRKAFSLYGIKRKNVERCESSITHATVTNNSSDDDDDTGTNLEIGTRSGYNGYGEDSSSEEEDDSPDRCPTIHIYQLLPRHLRCASHTLSLCVTVDAVKAMKNSPELSMMHASVLKKCNRLWNCTAHPKSAEIIKRILGRTLSRPGETRWNSFYDSLNDILAIKKETTQLFKALGLKHPLTEHEFDYIEEHVECTRPIANLIDILQGEKDIFFGILLPSLFALKRKLDMLSERDWVHCGPLVASLKESVHERFSSFFTFTTAQSMHAAIAAFAYPRFKRRWLQCVDASYHATLLAEFTNAVHMEQRYRLDEMVNTDTMNADNDEYFDFGQSLGSRTSPTSTSHSELLIHQYFADPTRETSSLLQYPAIQAVFFRYNTPLPSSAPVERLFSYATMINLPKCNALSDEMFETRVVLKANMGQILF